MPAGLRRYYGDDHALSYLQLLSPAAMAWRSRFGGSKDANVSGADFWTTFLTLLTSGLLVIQQFLRSIHTSRLFSSLVSIASIANGFMRSPAMSPWLRCEIKCCDN
jgi:hypothetical protein